MGSGGSTKPRFEGLDLIRGIAAFAVLQYHLGNIPAFEKFYQGFRAVDLFFVLSGFVLAHAYAAQLASGETSVRRFMVLRLIRIYPLYILGCLATGGFALLDFLNGRIEPVSLIASGAAALMLLPVPPGLSIVPPDSFPLNTPAWSIFWEMAVNLAFAILLVAFARGMRLIPAIVIASGLLQIVLAFDAFGWGGIWDPQAGQSGSALRATFGFFAGVWLGQSIGRFDAPQVSIWAIAVVTLVFLSVPVGSLGTKTNLLVTLIVCPLLVWFAASAHMSERGRAIARRCGALSYPVYILQWSVLAVVWRVTDKLFDIDRGDSVIAGNFVPTFAVLAAAWFVLPWDERFRA